MKAGPFLLLVLPMGAAGYGQPLTVYSEFAQINASGNVAAPETPREILSPAIARNAFASFQVVVQVAPGTKYELWVSQNPEKSVKATLYRENGDRLERLTEPATGDTTQIFWLDLWRDKDSAVERIKVEPQLHVYDDWVIYPMEARVMSTVVPDGPRPTGNAAPADVMKAWLCNSSKTPQASVFPDPVSITAFRFRNAQQDLALVAKAPRTELQQRFGSCTARESSDPEWYLRIRDYLLQRPPSDTY